MTCVCFSGKAEELSEEFLCGLLFQYLLCASDSSQVVTAYPLSSFLFVAIVWILSLSKRPCAESLLTIYESKGVRGAGVDKAESALEEDTMTPGPPFFLFRQHHMDCRSMLERSRPSFHTAPKCSTPHMAQIHRAR